MAQPEADLLVRRYAASLVGVQNALAQALLLAWDQLGGYDEEDAVRFIEIAAPLALQAQQQAGTLADTYVALFIAALTGAATVPVGETVLARPNVDSAEVYRRPFVQAWKALAQGVRFADAVAGARARVAQTAASDVQLAARNTTSVALQARPSVVGYRRVLGGGRSCGLCIVASTQRYKRDRLMPVHPACRCTVRPILGERDPGQVVDRARLRAIKQQVEGKKTRADYGRLRVDADQLPSSVAPDDLPKVDVVEHGEFGPLLWDAAHDFTRI